MHKRFQTRPHELKLHWVGSDGAPECGHEVDILSSPNIGEDLGHLPDGLLLVNWANRSNSISGHTDPPLLGLRAELIPQPCLMSHRLRYDEVSHVVWLLVVPITAMAHVLGDRSFSCAGDLAASIFGGGFSSYPMPSFAI
jgi:hypothetical protein